MTSIEEMPKSGYLLLSVYFSGYEEYYQNETRRNFGNDPRRKQGSIPEHIKKISRNIKLEPIDFSLIRGVIQIAGVRGGTRARGAQQLYRYETSGSEQVRELCNKIAEYCKRKKMWKRFDLYFVDKIWGI